MPKDNKKPQAQTAPANGRLFTLWQLISFGVLTTPLAMGGLALVMFLPTFYATDMRLGFGLVGMIFVIGRLLDVVTDPIIGHLSDETHSRFGPRKPWIVVGTAGFCVAIWLLLNPPENAGLLYLLIASSLYFIFYTTLDVPYSSIGLEISPDIHERSFLASSKAIFQVIGALTAAAIPFLFALSIPLSLTLIAKITILLCLLGLGLFLAFVPNRHRVSTAPRAGIRNAANVIFANHAYRYLIGTFLIVQTANALTAGLTVLFITHVIGRPELIGLFMGLVLLSSALGLPLWVILSKRKTKAIAWQTAIIICACTLAFVPFLGQDNLIGFAIICIILGAAFGCDAIMPTSILADIVYAEEKKGKSRFAGFCLAVKNAASKLAFIAPMGLAFPVLDLIGFDKDGNNSPVKLLTLIFFYALLPIAIRLIALFVLRKAPFDDDSFIGAE